ncbi:MAG: 4'-phosphopantetheinyl transferase superfamily protein [Roseburia sp.]|nr:4'-phosphopantetheinyl transferase superfamily protein [Roseburia sp.]
MKIYYAKIPVFSEKELQKVLQFLPRERMERIERTKLMQSKLQSVAAGLLLEYALREFGIESRNLTFIKNADGKPAIAEYPDFHYNLSHAKEYVALVTDCHAVGIDIEYLRVGYQRLVSRFFSEEEQSALSAHWSDEDFTRIWTRKESYLKASGYGMRMPLAGFSTLGEQVMLNEGMNPDMVDSDAIYYMASLSFFEGYWLSVCRKDEPIARIDVTSALQRVDLRKSFIGI